MYKWEKSLRDDNMKQNPKSPSFSSTLLDEIYRKIDGNNELKHPKQENVKKRSSKNNNGDDKAKARSSIEDENMASFRRACLIEKWMEKKVNEKVLTRRGSLFPEFDPKLMQDNDPLFFSSCSNSSDSSFGFSSSENESFGAVKSKNLCFTAPRPKLVRTNVRTDNVDHSAACHEQSEFYLFDDYCGNNRQTNKTEGLIKSKTRAMKIYENIKKVKQPISPGGRLTSFINNLITNGKSKKNKNSEPTYAKEGHYNVDRKTQASSKCSSASSFSRFYLSKDSSNVIDKVNNVAKGNEGSRHCSLKTMYDEDFERFPKPMPPRRNEDLPKFRLVDQENLKKNEFVATNARDEDSNDEDYDQDDAASDSSSDLFELDHLALFPNDTFYDDLPVYETTHLGTNHAIANGLIR